MEEEKRKSDVESANASEDFEEQASFFDNLGTQLQQQQQQQQKQQQQQQRQQPSAAQVLEGNFPCLFKLSSNNQLICSTSLWKSNLSYSHKKIDLILKSIPLERAFDIFLLEVSIYFCLQHFKHLHTKTFKKPKKFV